MRFLLSLITALFLTGQAIASETTGVVVTIKPLHSLVQGVMGETGEATLLISGAASPHGFSLKPSQVKALQEAKAVFYVDEAMESFLKNALESLPAEVRKVPASHADGIVLLERREGGAWDAHDHDEHEHEHEADHDDHDAAHKEGHAAHKEEEHHDHEDHDGEDHDAKAEHHDAHDGHAMEEHNLHLWLDPVNAKMITLAVAEALNRLYPENKPAYDANAKAILTRLDALDHDLHKKLAPLEGKPFVVLHDAYPYLEARYHLTAVGSLTLEPDEPASAKKLKDIRAKLQETGAECLFREPQFNDRLLKTAAEGLPVTIGVLDPLGADLDPGSDLYFNLLNRLADNLVGCLQGST